MAEDWLADVRKYVADADETVVSAIVKYLGIALRNRDSSLVSFSDKKEPDRVRENFLKKKLGLTDDDATLDAAIAGVGERMKEDRTKNRVTVYYLLAQHFGLLTIFGGAAGVAGAAVAAAGLAGRTAEDNGGAIDTNGGATAGVADDGGAGSAAPLAAAGLAGASAATAAAAAPPPPAAPAPSAAAPQTVYSGGDGETPKGGMGWLPWLLLLLLLAALLFFGLRYCSKQEADVAPATGEPAISETAAPADGTAGTATAAAIPKGAGVVAEERAGKPMLTVYFDTGKSEVSNDLTTAAASVKAYVDGNPGATLAVSGYNDPTGNAAANAELSKNRAQSVKAALERLGFAADKVVLEKPAETTTTGTDNAAARRVEVTVKG